ncbi:uncharacterized protein METZ01_LOCUS314636 [marine metagenome]|uniref:Uncharacterized protein n=1 Tax=marine metagenome TaxID=408172 RepID=A0A382NPV2_9ZZZZ
MLKRKVKQILVALALPILSILFLTNCSSVKKLEISSVAVERVPLVLPEVDRIKLESIDWYIVNKDNLPSVLAELDKKGYKQVIFGITDKGYEILSVNMAKIQQLVRQQNAIIGAYQLYYTNQQKAIEKSVENNKKVNDKIEKHNENVEIEGKKSFTSKLGAGIKKIF